MLKLIDGLGHGIEHTNIDGPMNSQPKNIDRFSVRLTALLVIQCDVGNGGLNFFRDINIFRGSFHNYSEVGHGGLNFRDKTPSPGVIPS